MRLTLLGRPRLFLLTTFDFLPPRSSEKSLRDWNTPYPYTRPESDSRFSLRNVWLFGQSPSLLSGSHICFRPTFVFRTTFDYLPHLPFRLLLICSHICLSLLLVRSHICFSDDFCFAQFIRRNFFPSGRLLHSFSTNLRFPAIFAYGSFTLLFLIISFILSCFSYQWAYP